MNVLFSTGETINLAVGETYTLKDDEAFVNSQLYKRRDLEIIFNGNDANATQEDVRVGIRLRDGLRSLPADLENYEEWTINGIVQTSLSQLIENINSAIQ